VRLKVASAASTVHNLRIEIFSPVEIFRKVAERGGMGVDFSTSSFRDGPKDQTSDVRLHIGESRDSGFIAARCPGMTMEENSPSGSIRFHPSSLASKNIPFRACPKSPPYPPPSRPTEGRIAIVTDAGRDAMDADGAADESTSARTAKSCGPDASTLASSWRRQLR
jgi:hypothetical protein